MRACVSETSTTEDYETQKPSFKLNKAGVCVEDHSRCFNTPRNCSHPSFLMILYTQREKKNLY